MIKKTYNVPRMWQSPKMYDSELFDFGFCLEYLFAFINLAKEHRLVNENFDKLIYGKEI